MLSVNRLLRIYLLQLHTLSINPIDLIDSFFSRFSQVQYLLNLMGKNCNLGLGLSSLWHSKNDAAATKCRVLINKLRISQSASNIRFLYGLLL